MINTVRLTAVFFLAVPAIAAQESTEPVDPNYVITTSKGDIVAKLFASEAPKTVENFIGLAEGTKEFTDSNTQEEVKRPFYDGLTFHRVIKGFMIQGGCPLGTGTGGPGYRFEDEINADALGLSEMKALDAEDSPHDYLLIRTQQDFARVVVQPLLKKMGIETNEQLNARREEFNAALRALTLKDVYENMGYKYNDSRPSHTLKRGVLAMANSGPNTNGSQFFINLVDTPWLTGKHTVFGEVVKGLDVLDAIGSVPVDSRTNKPLEPVHIISIRRQKP